MQRFWQLASGRLAVGPSFCRTAAAWLALLLFFVAPNSSGSASAAEAAPEESRAIAEQHPGKVVILGHLYAFLAVRDGGGGEDLDAIARLVHQLEKIDDLAAIIIAGDLVIQGVPEEYERLARHFFAKFDVPFYFIPANHETPRLADFESFAEKVPYRAGNQSVRIAGVRYTMFSAWKATQNSGDGRVHAVSRLDRTDLKFLKGALGQAGTAREQDNAEPHIFISADYRIFDDPEWKREVQPLIDRHIDYVVIGDNESTQHRFGWIQRAKVPYIFQGMTQPGRWGGISTFLTIERSGDSIEIEVHPIHFPRALSKAYRFSGKGGPEHNHKK